MRSLCVAFVVAALAVVLGPAFGAGADCSKTLEGVRADLGAPAIAGAVVRGGEIVAIGAAGVRKLGDAAAVGVNDAFLIGSCAKSMLRMLVGKLVDEGALRFDMTLAEALPGIVMRDEYRAMTIGQALQHRAGLRPYTEITPTLTPFLFGLEGEPTEQRAAFAAHLLNEEPIVTPGGAFEYSNAGYGLVAHIAERAAGTPWERLVEEKLWKPLGMTSARVGYAAAPDLTGAPVGHFRTPEGWKPVPKLRRTLHALAPAGIVSCNARDFAAFGAALCTAEAGKAGFLSAASAAWLRDTRLSDQEGSLFFGGDGAFSAAYAVWPSKGVAVVALTSAGSADEVSAAAIEALRAAHAPECAKHEHPLRGSPHFRLFGFRIRAVEENEWEVGPVEPGSPADRAGVREGDAIVGINGKALAMLTLAERIKALKGQTLVLTLKDKGAERTAQMEARAQEPGGKD